MGFTVDCHLTFETNAHAAQWPARPAIDSRAKRGLAQIQDRRGEGRAFGHGSWYAVDGYCDQCSEICLEGL